ncbi:uncharacterized [Tachysurus ichikawai]
MSRLQYFRNIPWDFVRLLMVVVLVVVLVVISSRMRSRRSGLARTARLPSTSRAKPTHQSARDDERRKLFLGASARSLHAPRTG